MSTQRIGWTAGPEHPDYGFVPSRLYGDTCDCLACAEERQRLGRRPLVSDLERIARKMVIRELVRVS